MQASQQNKSFPVCSTTAEILAIDSYAVRVNWREWKDHAERARISRLNGKHALAECQTRRADISMAEVLYHARIRAQTKLAFPIIISFPTPDRRPAA